jgi:D-alanyl-lipoteichoic acid acyltransferase DltB (MBOAT superfamily)
MLFNTAQYGIFFVVVFAIHWLLPRRARRPFLLLASYYFYASAIPQYIALILALTAVNYALGLWIGAATARQTRKTLLVVAIAANLATLGFFKYSQLFVTTTQQLLKHVPLLSPAVREPWLLNILLPLGISFFTFEFIHYVAEVYKGMPAMRNPVDFALFAAFFPTQIAGPIKRFPAWRKQLAHPTPLREVDLDAALGLVLRGLLKKVLFADLLAPAVAYFFARPAQLGPASAWFAVLAFAAQIYGDFSGYTDLGRGCAQLLGYWVPENFAAPYQSANAGEFWRRWHMSLSSWLRDYLYIPLGGSRVSRPRLYVNLMLTMALGGLWHGAAWHFLVWGGYQGALLCAHRLWGETAGRSAAYKRLIAHPVAAFLCRPLTLACVCVGWVFFRADTLPGALRMLASCVALDRPALAGWDPALTTGSVPVLLMAGAAALVVGGWVWAVARPALAARFAGLRPTRLALGAQFAYAYALRPAAFVLAVVLLVIWPAHVGQRFIYFQF